MENFHIVENVPTIHPPITERAVGHLAALGTRLAVKAGQEAILMYARVYDDMYDRDTYTELVEQFAA